MSSMDQLLEVSVQPHVVVWGLHVAEDEVDHSHSRTVKHMIKVRRGEQNGLKGEQVRVHHRHHDLGLVVGEVVVDVGQGQRVDPVGDNPREGGGQGRQVGGVHQGGTIGVTPPRC